MKNIFICAMLVFSGYAFADGNSLLKNCKALDSQDTRNLMGIGLCAGYLQGVSDLNGFYEVSKLPTFFCMPDKVSYGQKAKVVIKYLEDHPEKLHEIDGGLVLSSFVDAFPCYKK